MIDNPRSPRVRAAANLHKKNARSKTGHFLVEGPQAVEEAVRHVPELLDQVFVSESSEYRFEQLLNDIDTRCGVEIVTVTDPVMNVISDTVTPQGIVAVCRQPQHNFSIFGETHPKKVVLLEQVRDPGNAGTIIRVADAAGFDAVIMTTKSVDPYNPKVVRSTTGSLFHLPVFTGVELSDAISALKSWGLSIFAADIKGEDLPQVVAADILLEKHAWLFGNEAHGLNDDDLQQADRLLKVPIYGAAESLNLATAAAVCLYQSAFVQGSSSGKP